MTEAELLAAVIRLARERGIRALHVPDSLTQAMGPDWSGFPDLLLIGDNGILWAELKADGRGGQLRASQRGFRWKLTAAGYSYVTWHPGHLRDGFILEALDDLAVG